MINLFTSKLLWSLIMAVLIGFDVSFMPQTAGVNIGIAFMITLVCTLITNRLLFSIFITTILTALMCAISFVKRKYLYGEFEIYDFYMILNMHQLGLYAMFKLYFYNAYSAACAIVFITLCFLIWYKSEVFIKYDTPSATQTALYRLASLCLAFGLTYSGFAFGQRYKSDAISAVEHFIGRGLSGNSAEHLSRNQNVGPFVKLLLSIVNGELKPVNLTENSNLIYETLNGNSTNLPDIVMILNESTFDPSKLDYPFAKNLKFNMFQKDQFTKFLGSLNVNTYGGFSWISEFEINTGIPHKVFSGPSDRPFLTLVYFIRNSLIMQLKRLGYETYVLYPVRKHFSNAIYAYKMLGIDQMYDVYDFDYHPAMWTDVQDSMIKKMITATLNKPSNKPKFIFASTVSNHGPHSFDTPDSIGCGQVMKGSVCAKLNDYVQRLGRTDKDIGELTKELMSRTKKTVIVNFGDHLPSFDGEMTKLKFKGSAANNATNAASDPVSQSNGISSSAYYKTFFHIQANFSAPIQDKNYDALDITFIPGLVLDMTDRSVDEFYRANSLMRKTCNGILEDCAKTNPNLFESYISLCLDQFHIKN